MEKYQYTACAVDDSRAFTSTCYAPSEGAARSKLKRIGYTVNTIEPSKKGPLFSQRKRIKLQDLVSMCRRLSVMYGAGLSLMDCLSLLAEENESKRLSDILQEVQAKISKGSTITEAFSKYQDVFPPLFLNMVKAGEVAGTLGYVLDESAIYMEQQYELKRKVRQAFAYPVVVMVTIFAVVTLMMIFVVPTFSDAYLKMGADLPGITQGLILVSNNAMYIFPSLIALAVALWFTYKKLKPIPAFRKKIDKIKISMPVIGAVFHKILLLRFLRTLSLTFRAGLELPESIAIAEDVTDNAVASESVQIIQRNINRGGTISEAIQLHAFFPKSIAQAFAAGEEAGRLDEMLEKFADGMNQDVEDGVKRLVMLIEPAMVILLTAVVGFIAMAIYLPIFDLMRALKSA